MNHDYVHCADFKDDCPKECYRVQLVRELQKKLQKYGKLAPYVFNSPISWGHLKETDGCPIKRMMNRDSSPTTTEQLGINY